MSDLKFNAIAGSILAAGVVVMGLREVGSIVFHPEFPETPGYAVAIPEAAPAGGGAVAEAPQKPDWGTLFADEAQLASLVEQGDRAHRVCASCHSVEPGGANAVGPALYGVFGRVAGSHPGFGYSAAMSGYAEPWSYDNLYAFLENPKGYIPGTIMNYAGEKNQQRRIALVAYLRSLGSSDAPLPPPLPPQETAAASTEAEVQVQPAAPLGEPAASVDPT